MEFTKNPSLNRALEVAIVNNTPVLLCTGIYEAASPEQIINSLETIKTIQKRFSNYVNFATAQNFNSALKIEVLPEDFNRLDQSRSFESFETVMTRVKAAKIRTLDNSNLCEASKSILKTAYERLSFNENIYNTVLAVAASIAKLDGTNKIEVVHICESIQYQSISYTDYVQPLQLTLEAIKLELEKINL